MAFESADDRAGRVSCQPLPNIFHELVVLGKLKEHCGLEDSQCLEAVLLARERDAALLVVVLVHDVLRFSLFVIHWLQLQNICLLPFSFSPSHSKQRFAYPGAEHFQPHLAKR